MTKICFECKSQIKRSPGVHCSTFISDRCLSERVLICKRCFIRCSGKRQRRTMTTTTIAAVPKATASTAASTKATATAVMTMTTMTTTTSVSTFQPTSNETTSISVPFRAVPTSAERKLQPLQLQQQPQPQPQPQPQLQLQHQSYVKWSDSTHPAHRFSHILACGVTACPSLILRSPCEWCKYSYHDRHTRNIVTCDHLHTRMMAVDCAQCKVRQVTICCREAVMHPDAHSIAPIILQVTKLPSVLAHLIATLSDFMLLECSDRCTVDGCGELVCEQHRRWTWSGFMCWKHRPTSRHGLLLRAHGQSAACD